MANAWDIYTKEMTTHFGYLATWTPGLPLALGDVGVMKNNVFTRLTSLADVGISFDVRRDESAEDIKHSSSGSLSFAFKAAGKAPVAGSALTEAEAGVTIEFTRDKAVVFEALGCTAPTIADQLALGKEIISRSVVGKWNKDWVVVTELVQAKSGTVLISERRGAKLELSAQGKVTQAAFSLADASIGLSIVSQRDMQTTLVSQNGLTPLFKARGIRSQGGVAPVLAGRGIRPIDLAPPADPKGRAHWVFDEVQYDFRGTEDE